MKLVVIFGPPAVGKMSVGKVVAERTGLKLFHNHDTIELILKYFDFGSDEFRRLTRVFRSAIFKEVSKSDLDGLIFTYVWAFDHPEDEQFLRDLCTDFEDVNAEIMFVELSSSLEERLKRNKTPERLEAKASKRDLVKSEANLLSLDAEVVMNSDSSGIPFDFEYLRIETDELSKEETAEQIIKELSLLEI